MSEIRKCAHCPEGELYPYPEISLNYWRPTRGRGLQHGKIETLLCNVCGMIAFRKVDNDGKAEG